MILGSLVIGLLTAYYFGIRPGIMAAAGAALLFFAAAVLPGITLLVYAVVAAFIIAVCFIGPRQPQREDSAAQLRRLGKQLVSSLWRRL